ncbi:hypothetical protein V2J09_020540 [Rumex salicifolius]
MPSRPANGHHRPPLPPPLSNSNHRQNYYSASSYPPYSTTSSSSSPSIKGCICCLFLLFSLLALLVIAVVLVIVLAVKPKKPQFDLQQVSVQYVGISSNPVASAATAAAAASSASLSLNIRLLFTASNPNKIGIKYDQSRFTVMYRGIPLGEGIIPGFFQPAHSVKKVETIIAVDRVNLQQADASDLVRDASLNDRVELRVLGEVRANIRIMSFDSPGVQVSVDCAVVISPLKKAVTYKQCGFDGLNF